MYCRGHNHRRMVVTVVMAVTIVMVSMSVDIDEAIIEKIETIVYYVVDVVGESADDDAVVVVVAVAVVVDVDCEGQMVDHFDNSAYTDHVRGNPAVSVSRVLMAAAHADEVQWVYWT